jgi:signal transduction histidine kinase
VTSVPALGSTFTIKLPLLRQEAHTINQAA